MPAAVSVLSFSAAPARAVRARGDVFATPILGCLMRRCHVRPCPAAPGHFPAREESHLRTVSVLEPNSFAISPTFFPSPFSWIALSRRPR
jgi:hypothetical protein